MTTELLERLRTFVSELRRRRVLRTSAVYASAAFVLVQASDLIFEALGLGSAPLTVVMVIAILGFPVVAVVAWAFEFSSEGLERTEPRDAASSQLVQPRDSLTRDLLLVGLVVAGSAGLGWIGWEEWIEPVNQPGSKAPREDRGAERHFDARRIAVNYFQDVSPGGKWSHLARGLTDELIHELERIQPLDVVPPSGVEQYRGADVTRDSMVRALRVGSWVEGTVLGSEHEIRVSARLMDTNTGEVLESISVSRPPGDLFELQDDVVGKVVSGLRERLGTVVRRRQSERETESVAAWSLVRRAEELHDEAERLQEAGDRKVALGRLATADSLLSRAAAVDSSWVEPVVMRGRLALTRAELAAPLPTQFDSMWLRRGIEHAEAALERSPQDPAALELRGMARLRLSLGHGTPEEVRRAAESDLRAAVNADPSRARAWLGLSALYRREGRFSEASSAAKEAFEADQYLTLSPSIEAAVLRGRYQASLELGDRDRARQWCSEAHRKFPTQSWTSGCKLFNVVLFGRPDPDSAWSLLDSMLEHTREGRVSWNRSLGRMYVAMGLARRARMAASTGAAGESGGGDARERSPLSGQLADSARAVVEEAREASEASSALSHWLDYHEAYVRLKLGERDSALALLEGYLEANPAEADHLREDWLFEELRSDPRFQRLLDETR